MWPLSSDECYVSIDIEADGPVAGLHFIVARGRDFSTSAAGSEGARPGTRG